MARKAPQIDGVAGVRDKAGLGAGRNALNGSGSMYNTGDSASLAKGNMQDRGRGPKSHDVERPKPGGRPGWRGEDNKGDKTGFKASPPRKAVPMPQMQRGHAIDASARGAGIDRYEPRHTSKTR